MPTWLCVVGRRLVTAVPTLLIVTFLTYVLLYSLGDVVAVIAGENATLEERETIARELGLDRSVFVQYLSWLGHAVRGDLGVSFQSKGSTSDMIALYLPPTIWLSVLALLWSTVLALLIGYISARFPDSALDRALVSLTVIGMAIPNFLLGLILVLVLSLWLPLLPAGGYAPPGDSLGAWFSHLLLPSVALALALLCQQARTLRASMRREIGEDYVRTARAKGLGPGSVIVKHVTRNALLPMVTVVGLQLRQVITGAILIEGIFGIAGIGMLTVKSVVTRDYPVVMGLVLLFAGIVIIANLIVDVSYDWLSPIARKQT